MIKLEPKHVNIHCMDNDVCMQSTSLWAVDTYLEQTEKEKIRSFSIVRLVSKISHSRLAARLTENENNSK